MSNPERTQDKQDAAEVKNFTRTPNMLIFGYRELSPQEKWLYVCLKHLCGKRGTRHLSLRFISEQTGISVGALSKSKNKQGIVNEGMMRHLHDAGLIHTEIKKKDGAGNAQYHVTITDVWALNQSFFIKEECSDFGQDDSGPSSPVRTSDEPVQISDKPVHNSDAVVRTSDEPVRNPEQYQDSNKTNYKITDKTKQEGTYSAQSETATTSANAGAHAPSSQDEPYCPDFTLSQEKHPIANDTEGTHDRTTHSRGTGHSDGAGVGAQLGDRLPDRTSQEKHVASQSSQASDGYQKAEQATLLAVSEETKPVAEKKPKPLTMPPVDAVWKTTTCLQMFNFWRGSPLLAKHQQIKASQCAKALAENYTREQVEQVRAFMVERDEWWSLRPEAVDVCTVAENMHKKLAEMARANAKASSKPASKSSQGKGYTLAVNDPGYDIDSDFYNNAAAWAAFDGPKGDTIHA